MNPSRISQDDVRSKGQAETLEELNDLGGHRSVGYIVEYVVSTVAYDDYPDITQRRAQFENIKCRAQDVRLSVDDQNRDINLSKRFSRGNRNFVCERTRFESISRGENTTVNRAGRPNLELAVPVLH